jgi:hypothetical protein
MCDNLAHFITLANDWFDLMNSYVPNVCEFLCKSGYSTHESEQTRALQEMYETVKAMQCCGKNVLQEFQKGIMISTLSVQMLLEDCKQHFGKSYLLTHRCHNASLGNS